MHTKYDFHHFLAFEMESERASQIFAYDLVIPECKKCGKTDGWIYANREGPSNDLLDYHNRDLANPNPWTYRFIVSKELVKCDETIRKALTAYYHLCSCSPTEALGTLTGSWVQGAKLYPFSRPEFYTGDLPMSLKGLERYTTTEICESLQYQKRKCDNEGCDGKVDIMECHDQYVEAIACLNGSACSVEKKDDTWKRSLWCSKHARAPMNNFVIYDPKLIPNTGHHNTEPTWFIKRPFLKEMYNTETLLNLLEQDRYRCDVPGCNKKFIVLQFRDLHILAIQFPEDWGGRGCTMTENNGKWERVDVCDAHPEIENVYSWAVIEKKAMFSPDADI